MTDHFSSPQWVDLVRGVLGDEQRAVLEQHLRAGCEECQQAFAAWSGFAAFAGAESAYEPPREALRVVQSYLLQHQGQPVTRRRTWAASLLATLVFDSLQTAPAGVRASGSYSRHLLFAAQSTAIDLHVETASKAGWFLLAGQIADKKNPDQQRRIELALLEGETELSAFHTNEFGEFQCTFDRRKDLKLLFALEGGDVALPLDVLFSPSPSGNSPST